MNDEHVKDCFSNYNTEKKRRFTKLTIKPLRVNEELSGHGQKDLISDHLKRCLMELNYVFRLFPIIDMNTQLAMN